MRLPTDAEWDRATRAGATTVYFTGDSPASLDGYANVADRSLLRTVGDPKYASGGFPFDGGYSFTSPVGKFKPNAWGLYDMLGNVFGGAPLRVFRSFVVVLTTMAQMCAAKQRVIRMPNHIAGMPTSASA